MLFVPLVIAASASMWVFVLYLLATSGAPPAWLIWPLLVELAADVASVAIRFHQNRPGNALWRVCMTIVTTAAILWVVRSN